MPADPNRVRDLFLAVTDQPAADRSAYLAAACGSDADLRAAVEQLLAADAAPASILDRPAGSDRSAANVSLPETRSYIPGPDVGTVLVGRYKLVEQVGEGGMGSVWLARQTDPVKRSVAVKLIKPGMDSKAVLARFEAERQALALMDHPNIAKVHDAGATVDGRPFFVMELVKGVPITEFCDARKLTPRERLELFVPVCMAIQHAHQKGIIHRDIKPSNVLVAMYDDRPVPKVIDFGVAKATGQPLTDHTHQTGFGAVVGTPAYMSPEQATFNNLDIDTRADLYSLGILLYELLVGSPPFSRKDLERAGALEMLRIVREVEPPRPSIKLSSADALPSLAANRGTEPKKLTGMLRNELDWVVMKAIEKDRTRRYETANGLAADVLRYLSGEPVQAVPPSAGYRLLKFVRKRKGRVIAAGILLVAVLGATYGVIEAGNERTATALRQQAERARDAAERAQSEAVTARKDAETARETAEKARDGESRERKDAVTARDGEKAARTAAEQARDALAKEREKLARSEYGRTMQVAQYELGANNVSGARSLIAGTREDLRSWEWDHLNSLCNQELLKPAYFGEIPRAIFSPDGRRILVTNHVTSNPFSFESSLYDAVTGAEVVVFRGCLSQVRFGQFSADGRRVVTTFRDGTARIWDAADGSEVATLKGHTKLVAAASFSPDGERVVTSSDDLTARVWNASTGVTICVLKGHTGTLRGASFSPDGKWVLTASFDGTARVWDAATGKVVTIYKGDAGEVRTAMFSPDGRHVLTASSDKTARVWNPVGGTDQIILKCPESVFAAYFSPDGRRIATATAGGVVQVWDSATSEMVTVLTGHSMELVSLKFSPDGRRIVTASMDATARVWDVESGKEVAIFRGHTTTVVRAEFSPNGRFVVTASEDDSVRVWDATSPPEPLVLGGRDHKIITASFSPDSERVVTGGQDGSARLWDMEGGPVTVLKHTAAVSRAVFSPDGKRVLTGADDGTVRVWEAAGGKEVFAVKGSPAAIWSVAFSHDGRRIAAGSADRKTRVWDAADGNAIKTLEGNDAEIEMAEFGAAAGRAVAVLSKSPRRVWKAANGKQITVLDQIWDPAGVEFSQDGRRFVAALTNARRFNVWDVEKGTVLSALKGHTGFLNSVHFSPDGRRVLTASSDGSARLWDPESGVQVATFKPRLGGVSMAAFSPDGKRILTLSTDHTVQVWDSGRPLNMVDYYRRAARADSKSARAQADLGYALSRTGDLAGAIASLREALRFDPGFEQAQRDFAHVLVESADQRPTEAEYRRAQSEVDELSTKFPAVTAYRSAAAKLRFRSGDLILKSGDRAGALAEYRKGLAALEKLAADVPADPDRRAELAQGRHDFANVLDRIGDAAESRAENTQARQILEDLVIKQPARAEYSRNLTNVRFCLGEPGASWCAAVPTPGYVDRVMFSPDGGSFLVGGQISPRSPTRLYSTRTGELLRSFDSGEEWGTRYAQFSPDGTRVVASAWKSNTIYVWDFGTGRLLHKLKGHKEQVVSAEFSADGTRILSGSVDCTLRIWDAATGQLLRTLEGHGQECGGHFSPDGARVVSYSRDNTVRGWDVASGRELWKQPQQAPNGYLAIHVDSDRAFSKDASRVLSLAADGSVGVWETATGKEVVRFAVPVASEGAVFVAGGSRVAAWGKDFRLRVWEVQGGKAVVDLDFRADGLFPFPGNVTVSPNGRLLLTSCAPDRNERAVRLRDLSTGKILFESVTKNVAMSRGLTFSPDLRLAAAGSFRGWVHLWRLPAVPDP